MFEARSFILTLKTNNMPSEKRTSEAKITIELSKSLRAAFNRQSKKLNTSTSQRVRDFMQAELKFKRNPKKTVIKK